MSAERPSEFDDVVKWSKPEPDERASCLEWAVVFAMVLISAGIVVGIGLTIGWALWGR